MRSVRLLFIMLISVVLFLSACTKKQETGQSAIKNTAQFQAQITFIELGSNNCIPCREMQPVMHSIEEKYTGKVQVIFYDVWTKRQRHYAYDYNIRIIPTQIFLNAQGKEIMRHEGFFPQKEIERFLKQNGVVPSKTENEG